MWRHSSACPSRPYATPSSVDVTAAKLKPYSRYKDSGVEWLGAVPAHWEVRRLRTIAEMRVSSVDKHSREGERPVRLCNYVDVYKAGRIRTGMRLMVATAASEEIEKFRLRAGDVLITKDSEAWNDIGVPALVEGATDDTICGYHLALLRPLSDCVSGGFLFRAAQSSAVAYQFHVRANGVTRYGLTHNGIKSAWFSVPPPAEQAAIVRFLDHIDRRIRRYIRAKEKLIALLEEQKQASIHEAVTGRIDVRTERPYSSYKNAGVEWLAEMPEHWEAIRFSRLIGEGPKNGISPRAVEDGTVRSFAISAIRDGVVDVHEADVKMVALDPGIRRGVYGLVADDILLVRGNGNLRLVGRAGLVDRAMEEWVYPDLLMRVRLTRTALPRFVVAVLNSGVVRSQIEAVAHTAVGTFKVNGEDVRGLWLPVPHLDEQRHISQYIKERLAALAMAAEVARRGIQLVTDYRTRLFADVVTGKLDVRDVAAGLPEIDPLAMDDKLDGVNATGDGSDSEGEIIGSDREDCGTPARDRRDDPEEPDGRA
ncbi:MAG: hypothetical protein F4Y45_05520 [Acidobacteria bacterium]|nr:hypothetical protein [Acidobacteriota bacterium]MYJ04572.1 hypothetical protein [Acidobacteriota bacterium]